MRFDASAPQERVGELIEQTCPEELTRIPRASAESKLPIFIVGMPCSGTSLIEQILSRYPRITGEGELGMLGEISSKLDRCSEAGVERASTTALSTLSRHDEHAECIVDKMPRD